MYKSINVYYSWNISTFNDRLEVRGIFLNICKAFDKVWHEGLFYKLKQNQVKGNLLDTLTNFQNRRKQKVVLNGQHWKWANTETGVPPGSILGAQPFLIYINDLPDKLILNPKLFAHDTSLFSVINNKQSSANKLNQYLNRINKWAFQWKMSFNPDPSKQAQEVIFSRKLQKSTHPTLSFNNNTVTTTQRQSVTQKHLGMLLDTKLDLQGHLKSIFNKVNKTIGLLCKFHNTLPRLPLLTIYKSYRPRLDYRDVIYDQACNVSFYQKLESLQYNSALAITGAIRGMSTEKLYNEPGLETLEKRRWYRKLCASIKFILRNTFLTLFLLL